VFVSRKYQKRFRLQRHFEMGEEEEEESAYIPKKEYFRVVT
jgi:hypothetical protein